MTDLGPALARLLELPGVSSSVETARTACLELRRHPALRRRTEEARAEALLRAARCSAALEGARYPVSLFRDAAQGLAPFPDDASGRLALASLRLLTEARSFERGSSPAQLLARLHLVAGSGLLPADALGRPRQGAELPGDGIGPPDSAPVGASLQDRLAGITDLLAAPPATPALLVAALVHAEVATARPFRAGNGLVARGLARTVMVGRGLDPTGVVVWEAACLADTAGYARALAAYATGAPDAVGGWLRLCGEQVVAGAGEGRAVADAVLAGSLPRMP